MAGGRGEPTDDRSRGADGGTYTLLVELSAPATITFGAAGSRELPAGWLAYTGSALGPGGFARVDRHRRVAAGEHDVRHWHVDHLLGHPEVRLAGDVRSGGADAECEVARAIVGSRGTKPVPGVGATDCECGSHLATATDREPLGAVVRRAHGRVRD